MPLWNRNNIAPGQPEHPFEVNPAYNLKKEVPTYQLMRASSLGLSPNELYQKLTGKAREVSDYVRSTATAGTLLHMIEQAKAYSQGLISKTEEFVYDPVSGITGHVDVVSNRDVVTDIKTLSDRMFRRMVYRGRPSEKHETQVQFYMKQLGAEKGAITYIQRSDPDRKITYEFGRNQGLLNRQLQNLSRVRERIREELEAGILEKEDLLRGPSLATLQRSAEESKGEIREWVQRIPELKEAFWKEMNYMKSLIGEKFSGRGRDYNTIEGFRHEGMAGASRKEYGFGSSWRGIVSLPKSLRAFAGDRAGYTGPVQATIDLFKPAISSADISIFSKAKARVDLWSFSRQLRRGPFEHSIWINPANLREVVKDPRVHMTYGQLLKTTIRHERFHQAVVEKGLRERLAWSSIAVPEQFKTAYRTWQLGPPELMTEEYLAYSLMSAKAADRKLGIEALRGMFKGFEFSDVRPLKPYKNSPSALELFRAGYKGGTGGASAKIHSGFRSGAGRRQYGRDLIEETLEFYPEEKMAYTPEFESLSAYHEYRRYAENLPKRAASAESKDGQVVSKAISMPFLRSWKGKVGIGGTLLALYGLGVTRFRGDNRDWQSVDGFSETGFSGYNRWLNTDFGSAYLKSFFNAIKHNASGFRRATTATSASEVMKIMQGKVANQEAIFAIHGHQWRNRIDEIANSVITARGEKDLLLIRASENASKNITKAAEGGEFIKGKLTFDNLANLEYFSRQSEIWLSFSEHKQYIKTLTAREGAATKRAADFGEFTSKAEFQKQLNQQMERYETLDDWANRTMSATQIKQTVAPKANGPGARLRKNQKKVRLANSLMDRRNLNKHDKM